MIMRQIRTSIETKGMIEKLKSIYRKEKFAQDDLVTMTVGYVLNTAFRETENISDWNRIIDTNITLEEEFLSAVKETKTQVTRFRLADLTSQGIDNLTKIFADELGLRVQVGFTVKQILKAAILLREEEHIV